MFKITNIHVILVALGLAAYGFIQYQSSRIDGLKEDLKQMQQIAEANGKAIEKLKTDFVNLNKYDETRKENRAEADKSDAKMSKDAKREHVVKAKPKLVEKQLNESFNKLTLEFQEATK